MQRLLENLCHRGLDLIYPPRCVACLEYLADGTQCPTFCIECVEAQSEPERLRCRRCAARLPELSTRNESCYHCELRKTWFDCTFTLGEYAGLRRDLVLRMKADRSGLLSVTFGKMLVQRFQSELRIAGVDAVVPIPMTPWNRIMRGVNPPERIGTVLAKELRIPFLSRLLIKRRKVLPQHGLSMAGRIRNIYGGISCRTGYHLARSHLLLVDDVMTTGATVNEAARVLKREGVERVTVMVVARTPPT